MKDILKYFPSKIKNILENELENKYGFLEEIRIRARKPIILKYSFNEKILEYIVNPDEILNILQLICENSIYSYQHQITEGYITITGGHRVGISGSCVLENGKIININYINSLNFRIARQVKECSKKALEYIVKKEENTVYNTLIVSPPGARKNYIVKRYSKTNF